VQAANNQPKVKMEDLDNQEVGDYHSNSSSTQLPPQHPFHNRDQREHHGHRGGGVDLSTVPPTPLSNHHHLMSPIRQSTDGGSSTSHHYLLHSMTPERLAASGSHSGGEVGLRVTGGGLLGSGVASRGGVVCGSIPAGGVVVAGVAAGGGVPSVVDLGTRWFRYSVRRGSWWACW